MLDNNEFDLWANGYDDEVIISDKNNEYPFAGYGDLMKYIYGTVMKKSPAGILDVGIGTGTLASGFYEKGISITGIDFSSEMLGHAREKMPGATLIQCDFSKGLVKELKDAQFDIIISTYALHHLPDDMKIGLIKELMGHLPETGVLIYGDVMFQSRDDLDRCKQTYADEWDDDEYISVIPELCKKLQSHFLVSHRAFSFCSGVLEIKPGG